MRIFRWDFLMGFFQGFFCGKTAQKIRRINPHPKIRTGHHKIREKIRTPKSAKKIRTQKSAPKNPHQKIRMKNPLPHVRARVPTTPMSETNSSKPVPEKVVNRLPHMASYLWCLETAECTKIARFSAVAAAIFTARGEITRLFEAPRCAISSAKKIASEPRFFLRCRLVKMILAAEFPAITSSAIKIASEQRCAILVHSGRQPRQFYTDHHILIGRCWQRKHQTKSVQKIRYATLGHSQ